MKLSFKTDRISPSILFTASILLLNFIALFLNNSTFDSGDSILHFIYAKQSWTYSKYFLHHWAKPFFVLLASPFAQLGFPGMKLFNGLCVSMALVMLGSLYRKSFFASVPFSLLLGLSMPDLFRSQSSGLTEPLFALILVSGMYLYFRDFRSWGVFLWSFLPFVRSEGWFVIPVLAVLLIADRNWKLLPLFSVATVIYSLLGWPYYNDILWVFHENPYQGVEVKYGHGDWIHYGVQLVYGMGLPLFSTLVLGTLLIVHRTFRNREFTGIEIWAVVLFWSFFCAHSIFWAMGWFHSLGLRRVFIAVLPLTVIPIMVILKPLVTNSKRSFRLAARLSVIIVVLFPFLASKMGYKLPGAFSKDAHQLAADRASAWFASSDLANSRVSYSYHYLTLSLNRDMDDPSQVRLLNHNSLSRLPDSTVILWDDYFAVSDAGITEDYFRESDDYVWVRSFKGEVGKKRARIEVFYKVP